MDAMSVRRGCYGCRILRALRPCPAGCCALFAMIESAPYRDEISRVTGRKELPWSDRFGLRTGSEDSQLPGTQPAKMQ